MGDENAGDDRPVHGAGLEVTELDAGLIVYQASPEQVHHLNNTAALVFELSTGQWTVAEIATQIGTAFALDEAPVEAVRVCVAQLRRDGVLR